MTFDEMGRKGGLTTKARHGADYLRNIAAIGGKKSKGVPKRRRGPATNLRPAGPHVNPKTDKVKEKVASLEAIASILRELDAE